MVYNLYKQIKGLMGECIKECGKWENSTEKGSFIMLKVVIGRKEFGMKERELDGFNQNNYYYLSFFLFLKFLN